jgi:hypothetical protein
MVKLCLSAKRVKEPFLWFQLVHFDLLYDIYNQRKCHRVVATMKIVFFGVMCRYSDVIRFKRGTIRFESNLSSLRSLSNKGEMQNFVKVTSYHCNYKMLLLVH